MGILDDKLQNIRFVRATENLSSIGKFMFLWIQEWCRGRWSNIEYWMVTPRLWDQGDTQAFSDSKIRSCTLGNREPPLATILEWGFEHPTSLVKLSLDTSPLLLSHIRGKRRKKYALRCKRVGIAPLAVSGKPFKNQVLGLNWSTKVGSLLRIQLFLRQIVWYFTLGSQRKINYLNLHWFNCKRGVIISFFPFFDTLLRPPQAPHMSVRWQ